MSTLVLLILCGGLGVVALLVGLYVRHHLRCRRERLQCANELPELAEALGLEYERPRQMDRIVGNVSGTYREREIALRLGSGSPLKVGRRNWTSFPARFLDVKTDFEPEEGWVELETGDAEVDAFFRTRQASVAFAETIRSTPELRDALGKFVRRWAAKLDTLTIENGATARLRTSHLMPGEGEEIWQPVADLREFIPELVDLLDTLQRHAPPERGD